MQQEIRLWQKATNTITKNWIKGYFELSKEEVASGISYYWVADEIGGVFEFADYFIDFYSIIKCYELNVSKEKFFEYYDFCLATRSNIPLEDFILSPQKRLEKEQKYLQELKNNIIFAEQEFNKALENFKK